MPLPRRRGLKYEPPLPGQVPPKRRARPTRTVSPAEASADGNSNGEPSMTGGVPSAPIQQAYRDVTRGLQDTDRGAEAGRAYQKLKR